MWEEQFDLYCPVLDAVEGAVRKPKTTDRRVAKTRVLLREALTTLIREKPYERVTVSEILARANVGRSTFYTHFRDKDELLLTGIDELLHTARSAAPGAIGPERILRFSLPVLEHVEKHRRAGLGVMGAAGWRVIHGRLRQALARLLAGDVRAVLPQRARAGSVPPELLAESIAAAFVLTLHWWVEQGSRVRAGEANEIFRALTLPVLNRTVG